jgi:hypothetical protein
MLKHILIGVLVVLDWLVIASLLFPEVARRIWQGFWGRVWWFSEFSGIGLGRFAPWVFGQMIRVKGVKRS